MTMEEMSGMEERKQMMAKTSERLRVLEKLERYREERMRKELDLFE